MSYLLKPPGYNTLAFVNGLVGRSYKAFNGFVSGNQAYGPAPTSAQRASFTFSGAPANLSTIAIPDGPLNQPGGPNVKTFTFTWAGAPGAGIIPLVAGGGTAAQAATAAYNAMLTQLTNWVPTNPASTILVLTSLQPGVNNAPVLGGVTNAVMTRLLASLGAVLPARFGKNYAFFSSTPGPVVGS